MNLKSIIVFTSIFLVQLIMSCNSECQDYVPQSTEYTGITITAWDTSGFYETVVKDSVSRNSFGISFYPNYETQENAHLQNGFSFSAAMACDPVYPKIADPIDYVEIYVTDDTSGRRQNATELFSAYKYYDELIPISELFTEQDDWYHEFQVQLVQSDSIPSLAIFTIHLYLESGTKLSADTEKISFYD